MRPIELGPLVVACAIPFFALVMQQRLKLQFDLLHGDLAALKSAEAVIAGEIEKASSELQTIVTKEKQQRVPQRPVPAPKKPQSQTVLADVIDQPRKGQGIVYIHHSTDNLAVLMWSIRSVWSKSIKTQVTVITDLPALATVHSKVSSAWAAGEMLPVITAADISATGDPTDEIASLTAYHNFNMSLILNFTHKVVVVDDFEAISPFLYTPYSESIYMASDSEACYPVFPLLHQLKFHDLVMVMTPGSLDSVPYPEWGTPEVNSFADDPEAAGGDPLSVSSLWGSFWRGGGGDPGPLPPDEIPTRTSAVAPEEVAGVNDPGGERAGNGKGGKGGGGGRSMKSYAADVVASRSASGHAGGVASAQGRAAAGGRRLMREGKEGEDEEMDAGDAHPQEGDRVDEMKDASALSDVVSALKSTGQAPLSGGGGAAGGGATQTARVRKIFESYDDVSGKSINDVAQVMRGAPWAASGMAGTSDFFMYRSVPIVLNFLQTVWLRTLEIARDRPAGASFAPPEGVKTADWRADPASEAWNEELRAWGPTIDDPRMEATTKPTGTSHDPPFLSGNKGFKYYWIDQEHFVRGSTETIPYWMRFPAYLMRQIPPNSRQGGAAPDSRACGRGSKQAAAGHDAGQLPLTDAPRWRVLAQSVAAAAGWLPSDLETPFNSTVVHTMQPIYADRPRVSPEGYVVFPVRGADQRGLEVGGRCSTINWHSSARLYDFAQAKLLFSFHAETSAKSDVASRCECDVGRAQIDLYEHKSVKDEKGKDAIRKK